MHASQRNQNHMPVPAPTGAGGKSHKTLRLTLAANGTFFEVQGDIREDGGVNLHLATDGDAAELQVQCVDKDAALRPLRIFDDQSA